LRDSPSPGTKRSAMIIVAIVVPRSMALHILLSTYDVATAPVAKLTNFVDDSIVDDSDQMDLCIMCQTSESFY
jgi:hypothetical protein